MIFYLTLHKEVNNQRNSGNTVSDIFPVILRTAPGGIFDANALAALGCGLFVTDLG